MVCQPLELPEKMQHTQHKFNIEMLQPSSFRLKAAALNRPGNKAKVLPDSLRPLERV